MKLNLNGLTPHSFLQQYWQKKPVVIRAGFSDFQDLLSPEELAGLACEEVVESRIVYQDKSKQQDLWQAEFGPFDSYEHLGENDWTLIVQAVNNWVPGADELIRCFDFIPRWRLDDVMVSFGTPGGGVGPHIDLYDVFICQGSGSRRWRVGDRGPHKEFAAHPALLHCEDFEPIIDVELNTGDILYIPPGFPHDGVSLQNSMSFSVGYRTDSAQQMHSALADYMIDNELCNQQIEDPTRNTCEHPGQIDSTDFARIKQHLLDAMDDKLLSNFIGNYLTRSKCALDLPEQDLGFEPVQLLDTLQQQPLVRLGGLRCLYLEHSVGEGIVYIDGRRYQLSRELAAAVVLLCDSLSLSHQILAPWLDNEDFVKQLTGWVNQGYWYFDQ